MKFTEEAMALLKRLEACRLVAYQDGAGVWTIGYGHTGPEVKKGLRWTQEEADDTLHRDVAHFEDGVRGLVKRELDDRQFSALVIFAFNIGLAKFAGSSALRDVRAGQLERVPEEIERWKFLHDRSGVPVVSPGLASRRAAEVALWKEAVA